MVGALLEWLRQWLMSEMSHYGLWVVFFGMIIESACIPLPSEIIMPLGGFMSAQGHFSIWWVALLGTMGNLVGGTLAYVVGRTGGRKIILKYGRYIMLSEKHLDKSERWFRKKGEMTVFWSRLLPAIRTFISLPAGIAHMNFWRFALYTTIGSFPWALGLAYIGYFFGSKWGVMEAYLSDMNYVLWGLAALVFGFWYINRRRKASKKALLK